MWQLNHSCGQNDLLATLNKRAKRMINIIATGMLLMSAFSCYAEVTSAQNFCQRLNSNLSTEYIQDGKKAHCQQSSINWFDGVTAFEHYAAPVTFEPEGKADFHVLILSPKWSNAYDVSSSTLIEQLDSKGLKSRFTLFNYQGNEAQAQAIVKAAERNSVDLIYSMGSSTTAFISDFYRGGSLPVVSVCSKDPISMGLIDPVLGISQSNIAYTSLNINVSTQIAYFKERFLAGLEHIAVIYDKNNLSSIVTQVKPLKAYLQNSDSGISLKLIEVDFTQGQGYLERDMAEFVGQSKQLGDSVFLITGSTELFENIHRINQNAMGIPVVSVTPSHVTAGEDSAFMAIGVSFSTNAKVAADYGYRVLKEHVQPGKLPVGVVSTPDISINFSRKPDPKLKVPFSFFEDAVVIYNYDGEAVRQDGRLVFSL